MQFTPKTDEELEMESLLPDGIYGAVVTEAVADTSKSGNEMFKVTLEVHGGGYPRAMIWDYISPHFMHFKFKHFFKSADRMKVYEAGNVEANDILHANVTVQVGSQKSDKYPPKNVIVDYVSEGQKPDAEVVKDDDADLPF